MQEYKVRVGSAPEIELRGSVQRNGNDQKLVLFAHALGGNRQPFERLLTETQLGDALSRRHIRPVCLDWGAHGESAVFMPPTKEEKEFYSLARQTELLHAVVREVRRRENIDDVHLVTHSYPAAWALQNLPALADAGVQNATLIAPPVSRWTPLIFAAARWPGALMTVPVMLRI